MIFVAPPLAMSSPETLSSKERKIMLMSVLGCNAVTPKIETKCSFEISVNFQQTSPLYHRRCNKNTGARTSNLIPYMCSLLNDYEVPGKN
jgi:hypothetical protein